MSHVADEIDAQLNLTESEDEGRRHRSLRAKATKPGSTAASKPSARTASGIQARNTSNGRKSGDWTSPTRVTRGNDSKEWTSPVRIARVNDRQPVKKGIPSKQVGGLSQRKTAQSSEKMNVMTNSKKDSVNKGNARFQKQVSISKKSEISVKREKLTSSDSDSTSEDAKQTSSIASRTRTRSQSHSGLSGNEQSTKRKQVVSKMKDEIKSTKLTPREITVPRTRFQKGSCDVGKISNKQKLPVGKNEASSESDSSCEEEDTVKDKSKSTKLTPREVNVPRTRFQKGSSNVEKTTNKRKQPIKKSKTISKQVVSKIGAVRDEMSSESDTSEEEEARKSPPRTRSQSQSGTSGAEKTPTSKAKVLVKKKSNVKMTLSDTSDDETSRPKRQSQTNKKENKSAKKDKSPDAKRKKVSLSDTSDDDKPVGKDVGAILKETSTSASKTDRGRDDSESDNSKKQVIESPSKDTKPSASVKPRRRRKTDSEFETKRYPRRRGLRGQKVERSGEDDVGERAFYSDGDRPLNVKHGRIFDVDDAFQKCVKRTKKLHDSSEESGSEDGHEDRNEDRNEDEKDVKRSRKDDLAAKCAIEKTAVGDAKGRQSNGKGSSRDVSKQTANKNAHGSNNDTSSRPLTRSQSTESGDDDHMDSTENQAQSLDIESPVSPRGRPVIRAENLVLSPDDSVFRKKFLKPISPVRSSPRRRRLNLSSDDESPVTDVKTNPFFPPKRVSVSMRKLHVELPASRNENASSEDPAPDGKGKVHGSPGMQTRSVAEEKVAPSEDPTQSGKAVPGPSAAGMQARSAAEVKGDGNSKSEQSAHAWTRSQLHNSCDTITEKIEGSLKTNQLSEDQRKVKTTEPTDVTAIEVPQRVTRSRNQRKSGDKGKERPETIRDANNERPEAKLDPEKDPEDIPGTATEFSCKKADEEAQFAAPIPTKSFYEKRRRTRSISSTSSTSDVSNPSDLLDQSPSDDKTKSGSTDPPRRRTRSMSARRLEVKSPVQITRSISEPRKGTSSRIKNEFEGQPKITPGKPAPESPAPARRVTRLQAMKTETGDNREDKTGRSGEHSRKSPLKRTRSAFRNRKDGDDRKSAKKRKGDPNESSSPEIDKEAYKDVRPADQPTTSSHLSINAQHELSRDSNSPSPASDNANPPVLEPNAPILEPFQNYALNQAGPSALPELYEEQDAHRHMSPISPLPEPFQNFDAERSLSPLPVSPSESPPPMERPLSALSLPDLPPLPPLIAPLPPSPLRSILTRSSSRLANPERMVSPLTTPPPVIPRAISPLPQPPMPDAISPLKDDDSLDSLPGQQSPQRRSLIPSPRNFHAVAPRHAVAVPPHPAGRSFQAARCLSGNFEVDDEDVPGPSGINTVNDDGQMFKVPSSEHDQASKLMVLNRDTPKEKLEESEGSVKDNLNLSVEIQYDEDKSQMDQNKDAMKSDVRKQISNNAKAKCNKKAMQKQTSNKGIEGDARRTGDNKHLVRDTEKIVKDLEEGQDKTATGDEPEKIPLESNTDSTQPTPTDAMVETANKSDSGAFNKCNIASSDKAGAKHGKEKEANSGKLEEGISIEREEEVGNKKGKRGKGRPRKGKQAKMISIKEGIPDDDRSKQSHKADTNDGSDEEGTNIVKDKEVDNEINKRRDRSRPGKDEQGNKDLNKESTFKDSSKSQRECDIGDNGLDGNAPKAIMTRGRRRKSLDSKACEDSAVQRRSTRSMRRSASKETDSTRETARMALENLGNTKTDDLQEDKVAGNVKKETENTAKCLTKVETSEKDGGASREIKESSNEVADASATLEEYVDHVEDDSDPGKPQKEKTERTKPALRRKTTFKEEKASGQTSTVKNNNGSNLQEEKIAETKPATRRKTSASTNDISGQTSLVKDTKRITRGKKRKESASTEDTFAALEKEGIVTSETDVPPKNPPEPTNQDPSDKQTPKGKSAQNLFKMDVKHSVMAKPCSSNLATSKRTIIVIPAAEMRVSGFKRSASWQKRRVQEQGKPGDNAGQSKPAGSLASVKKSPSNVTTAANSQPGFVTDEKNLPSETKSELSSSVPVVSSAPLNSVSKKAKMATSGNDNLTSGVESAENLQEKIEATSSEISQITEKGAGGSFLEPTQDAPHSTPGATKSNTGSSLGPEQIATPLKAASTTVGSSQNAAVSTQSGSDSTPGLTNQSVTATLTYSQGASNTTARPSKSDAGSTPGPNQSVTDSTKKTSNKIGNMWGNIAKETRQAEKKSLAEKIEITNEMRESRALRKTAKVGSMWGEIAATVDGKVEEVITEDMMKNMLPARRRITGVTTSPLARGDVGAAWGDLTVSGEGQKEVSRRRRKIPAADKIPAKQQKLQVCLYLYVLCLCLANFNLHN